LLRNVDIPAIGDDILNDSLPKVVVQVAVIVVPFFDLVFLEPDHGLIEGIVLLLQVT
jgi:hypothetical protein